MATYRSINGQQLRRILAHPTVSLAKGGLRTPALDLLVRARISRSNFLRGRKNWAEERTFAQAQEIEHGKGSAYDAGYMVGPPSVETELQVLDGIRHRFREALKAEGLPDDLRNLISKFLAKV